MKENELKAKAFEKRYGVKPLLPNFKVEPKVYYKEEVPYMILYRYDFRGLPEGVGAELFNYQDRLLKELKEEEGVYVSQDGKYYLNCHMQGEYFNVLVQAKEEDIDYVLIKNAEPTIKGFLGLIEDPKHVDMDTAPEEAED